MRLLLPVILLLLITNCRYRDAEVIDINGMPIHGSLVDEFTGILQRPYELFIRRNWISDAVAGQGQSHVDTIRNGMVFRGVIKSEALNFYNYYKKKPLLQNKYIFLSNATFTYSGDMAYDLVILKANNQFQALKIMNTNGLKQGISHTQVFEFIAALNEKNPIEIFLLEENRVGFYLKNTPNQRTKDELSAISPGHELRGKTVELYWPK